MANPTAEEILQGIEDAVDKAESSIKELRRILLLLPNGYDKRTARLHVENALFSVGKVRP